MGLDSVTGSITSSVTKKVNDALGFGAGNYALYSDFLQAILQDAHNCTADKSLWVGFFTFPVEPKAKEKKEKKSLGDRIKGAASNAASSAISSAKEKLLGPDTENVKSEMDGIFSFMKYGPIDPHPWYDSSNKCGYMANAFLSNSGATVAFISGVKVPSEGFEVERPSNEFNVGGYIKAPITKPRRNLEELEITFLETNTSLVDLVIRPWVIHSSYWGLKFAKSATFTMHKLTRSPSGFKVRQKIAFYNVVPISVDAEEYVYSPDTECGKRQVKFVYSDYAFGSGEELEQGFLSDVANMVKGFASKVVSGVTEAAVDLGAGAASGVFTNVKGSLVGAARDVIQDAQSRIRTKVSNAEDRVTSSLSLSYDKSLGEDKNADTPSFKKLSGVGTIIKPTNDIPLSPAHFSNPIHTNVGLPDDDSVPLSPAPVRNAGVFNNVKYTIKSNSEDDMVDAKTLRYTEITSDPSSDITNAKSLQITTVPISNVSDSYKATTIETPQNDSL